MAQPAPALPTTPPPMADSVDVFAFAREGPANRALSELALALESDPGSH